VSSLAPALVHSSELVERPITKGVNRHAVPPRRSLGRTFATYAVVELLLVAALGVALSASYSHMAQRRGLAEGTSEAVLISQTVVEPILGGRPLSDGLTNAERTELQRNVSRAIASHGVLRLRLRDLAGKVVFADDTSAFKEDPEEAVFQAVKGATVARLTHLNGDPGDLGPPGPETVEVYLPLAAGTPRHEVGVLEIYLPYAPIRADVTADLGNLYRALAAGLALLYVVLFGIAYWVSRGLRKQVARNAYLAEHDTLTDLPNRSLYRRRAEEALEHARPSQPVALAIVDLDRFKDVNDTLGHRNGDALLCEVARRIEDVISPPDVVARLGGDEFGLVIHLDGDPDADATFKRLRDLIDLETAVAGLPISVEASIGYVVAPDDGTDVDELLQRADIAMYAAKARNTGVARYDKLQDTYDSANLTLVAELRHAITAGQLVLHYQPKSRLSDGQIVAVEALVRWDHPSYGLLPPGRFLPLVEQTDLIFDLTDWVVDAALSDLRRFPAGISVAINASARSLGSAEFAKGVIDGVRTHEVEASRVIVEVTETALLADPIGAAGIMRTLSSHGVRVSIDDFGSGQTSLGYLSSLPIHELKIDRGFVSDMLENPGHAAIVRSIVDLGHNLSLSVVGEGVETPDVLAGLRGTGCDEAQGYHLARPMPVAQVLDWLAERLEAGLTLTT
jgi:diguanylate cyclase (GGDEF)-like protein